MKHSKPHSLHPFWTPAGLFLLAFAARVIFYLVMKSLHPHLWSPKILHINGWLEIAENWIREGTYCERNLMTYFPLQHLEPTAARGPVPVLALTVILRVFGSHYFHALLVYSWLLSSASAVMVYVLSKQLFSSVKLALAAGLLYAFYLPEMHLGISYAAASESLFTLLVLIYFWMLYQIAEKPSFKLAAGSGALLGLAFLSRPIVLFFPLIFAIWCWAVHRRRAFILIGFYLAAFALCVSPWVIRNMRVFHRPILTTTLSGYNLLRHNCSIAKNEYRILTQEQFDPVAEEVLFWAGKDFERVNEAEADAIFKKEAVRVIREYPLRYLKLCALRFVWLWYKLDGERPVYLAQNILIYLLMVPGMMLVFFRRHALRLPAAHILYFVLMHALINAQFRFISPMMPYAIMLAVYAVGCAGVKKKAAEKACC